jgi:hypothetical protein
MARSHRVALAVVGAASWLAGGVASFRSTNGAGAAALIAAGVACGLLSFIGRWPSRISVSGNEASWYEVEETVASQIRVAQASGEERSVIEELRSLQIRLRELQRTGEVPPHPAEKYDQEVQRSILEALPGAEVTRHSRSRDVADFVVRYEGNELYVETKWRSDPTKPFGGSTLARLFAGMPSDARLLLVVNTESISAQARQTVRDKFGDWGQIITWRDSRDNQSLRSALTRLLSPTSTPGSSLT